LQNYENFFTIEKKVLQWKACAAAISFIASIFLSPFSLFAYRGGTTGEDYIKPQKCKYCRVLQGGGEADAFQILLPEFAGGSNAKSVD
jgi:hypothetical protein